MRLLLGLSLAIAGLTLVRHPRLSCFQESEPAAVRPQLPAAVKGYGLSVDAAKEDAYRQAARELAAVLRQQRPPLYPSQERLQRYVRRYLVEGSGESTEVDLGDNLTSHAWLLPLRTHADWTALLRAEHAEQRSQQAELRQDSARSRQVLTARFIAVLGLLLLASLAYCRLEKHLPRRQARWLRVMSIAVLAVLSASWWLW
jgi:hypothetical protein